MSPRAAWRLEQLGFDDVHDYRGGIADWMAAGRGRDGHATDAPTAGDLARVDVPTCSPEDSLGEAPSRVDDVCVVTNEQGIVVGLVETGRAERHEGDTRVGDIMEVLPYTRRPSSKAETLVSELDEAGLERVLLTTPDGRLIGVFEKDDGKRALAEQ